MTIFATSHLALILLNGISFGALFEQVIHWERPRDQPIETRCICFPPRSGNHVVDQCACGPFVSKRCTWGTKKSSNCLGRAVSMVWCKCMSDRRELKLRESAQQTHNNQTVKTLSSPQAVWLQSICFHHFSRGYPPVYVQYLMFNKSKSILSGIVGLLRPWGFVRGNSSFGELARFDCITLAITTFLQNDCDPFRA